MRLTRFMREESTRSPSSAGPVRGARGEGLTAFAQPASLA
jgi:hypothetical protein